MIEEGVAQVGSQAPDLALEGATGRVRLADYRGRQHVALYFMREFSCPMCRRHVAHLRDMYEVLHGKDTAVLVIGGGEREAVARLAAKLAAPFPLLADPNRAAYHRYGLEKALVMMQRSGTFLVDKRGILRYALRASLPLAGLDEAALLAAIDAAAGPPHEG